MCFIHSISKLFNKQINEQYLEINKLKERVKYLENDCTMIRVTKDREICLMRENMNTIKKEYINELQLKESESSNIIAAKNETIRALQSQIEMLSEKSK